MNFRMRACFALFVSLGGVLTAGIGCDNENSNGVENERWPYPIGGYDAVWYPCPLAEGEPKESAECADLQLPLYWDDPSLGTIPVHAKRLVGDGTGRSQLWLVHGGPGAAGAHDFGPTMAFLRDQSPDLDLYTIDHRGVGESSRLDCPPSEDPEGIGGVVFTPYEVQVCIDYLSENAQNLDAYTTTYAALDLAAFVEATRSSDKNVVLWGGSYGTYLLQRYLAILPDHVDGVSLMGIFPVDGTFITWDEDMESVAHAFFDACAADSFCADKFEGDPQGAIAALLERLAEGHCMESGYTPNVLRQTMFALMYGAPDNLVVAPLVYRLLRCEPEDLKAISHFDAWFFGEDTISAMAGNPSFSMTLQYNIILSEMWDHPSFVGVDLMGRYDEVHEGAIMAHGATSAWLQFYEMWPRYTDSRWDDVWPETQTPMLMLSGGLDPATPALRAAELQKHFDAPLQTYALFPQGAHNLFRSTALEPGDTTDSCATRLLTEFALAPDAPLDLSCVEDVVPMQFAGYPEVAKQFFGTQSLWEN